MEVHVPDHPVMTWRQFFVHMGIVVLGLLIAVSLEQTVEWLHHRHQRAELRESLQRDTEELAANAQLSYNYFTDQADWLGLRVQQLQAATTTHSPLPNLPPRKPTTDWDALGDPSFKAAKASGLVSLLSQDEVRVFSDVDELLDESENVYLGMQPIENRLNIGRARFGVQGSPGNHWTDATPEDVQAYIACLAELQAQNRALADENLLIQVAAEQISSGERDLKKMQRAEVQARRAKQKK